VELIEKRIDEACESYRNNLPKLADEIMGNDTSPVASPNLVGHANTRQVGGSHYKTGGIEHWDMVAMFQLDYFQGQITKYLFRWRKKHGVQDLEKARHFLDKYIELAKAAGQSDQTSVGDADASYVNQDGAEAKRAR